MIKRRTVLGAVAVAGLAPAALAQALDTPAAPPALDGLTALVVHTPDGARTTRGAHLRPGPAVVQFWATWCSPCLAEGRHLARIRQRVPTERLNIIGFNMDRAEVRATERPARFMARGRMNYDQLWGNVQLYRAFNNPGEGGQITLPRLYVFDALGRPVAAFGRYDGAATLRQLDLAIESVLI